MYVCSLADALYHFLPTEQSPAQQSNPNTSLLGLLVLVKGVLKAAVLLETNGKAVKDLMLMRVKAYNTPWGTPNLLEV